MVLEKILSYSAPVVVSRGEAKSLMNAAKSYRNLPPLTGLASLPDAMKLGLSVEECVRRLKRYHYAFKRLHQIFTARITA